MYWLSIGVYVTLYLHAQASKEAESYEKRCVSRRQNVKCLQVTHFPLSFPSDTKTILFDEMTIEELPPKAFANLPFLTKVRFTRSNIGSLASCSFMKGNITTIEFDMCVIGQINQGAFRETNDKLSVSFTKTKITHIYAFGFWNLKGSITLTMKGTTIHNLHPRAFYDITSDASWKFEEGNYGIFRDAFSNIKGLSGVLISKINFTKLECTSLDGLEIADQMELNENLFTCTCKISWLRSRSSDPLYSSLVRTGKCDNPEEKKTMNFQNVIDSGDLKCAETNKMCEKVALTDIPEHTCPKRRFDDYVDPYSPNSQPKDPGNGGHVPSLHFSKLFYVFLLSILFM